MFTASDLAEIIGKIHAMEWSMQAQSVKGQETPRVRSCSKPHTVTSCSEFGVGSIWSGFAGRTEF